jgi:hypothetical protein
MPCDIPIAMGCLRRMFIPKPARRAETPQTYSMAGLILAAMRLSRSLEDRHWHD